MSWPSGPASDSAHGSLNSGLGQRLARARYAHPLSPVFDAELWASTPLSNTSAAARDGRLLLLEVGDQAVVGGGHAHRQLGRGLLLLRVARVHGGGVLAHHLAVRRLDLRHVGADLEVEHAVPLGELGLGAARARRPRAAVARRARGWPARRRAAAARRLVFHPAKRLVGGRALARLALV